MGKKILLRSGWQSVNIGDIAHTPGALALFEKYAPDAEIIVWDSGYITSEIVHMIRKRFPGFRFVTGTIQDSGTASNPELEEAIGWCDCLIHNSGPMLVAYDDVAAFIKKTGKPYGAIGITYDGNSYYNELFHRANFLYFRDSVSLWRAKAAGITCPVMKFGPDVVFAADLYDEDYAERFLSENGLQEGKFACCIAKLRYTPFWKIKDVPFDEKKDRRNAEMKEHDIKPLREAVIAAVRELGLKVLLCPEDRSEMEVEKEMIYDRLPEDVKEKTVWKSDFWLTDQAAAVYRKSAGLFANEMHSQILCIGAGVPAIVCRWKEFTSKGYMWRDIGLGDWLFNLDVEEEVLSVPFETVKMLKNREESAQKVKRAQKLTAGLQKEMIERAAAL